MTNLNNREFRNKNTNTTLFLVPVFGINVSKLQRIGFINGFLKDKDRKLKDSEFIPIYLLFKPDPDQVDTLKRCIDVWNEGNILIENYDYPEGYTVVVLRFPNKYKDQYSLFLRGKYSKFSNEYKEEMPRYEHFLKNGKKVPLDSTQYMVCNKRVGLKEYQENNIGIEFTDDMEYWSKPSMEEETLDIENLVKKNEKNEE